MERAAIQTTLPARYYLDSELFASELESFYFNRWIAAGREEQVASPGDYFLREFGGESVIVTRDSNRTLRAFYNVCRHRGTRLCSGPQGSFGRRIQCPYHGWTYGLDGALLGAPHMNPETFRREDYPLQPVGVETWDGHVFLNLADHSGPLAEQLGELPKKFAAWGMSDLTLGRRIVYQVAANWKLIVSNFNECLHCPILHPALDRLTDYLGADNEPPARNFIGGAMGFKPGVETMSMDGVRRRDYLPGLDSSQRAQVCYYAIYPNLLLSLHPDYMMTHTLWPQAVDRTEVVCEFHFHPQEMAKGGFHCDDAVQFWDTTNREDWRIVEMSQAGIGSRAYRPGPYSEREELLAAFDKEVLSVEMNRPEARRI